MASSWAPLAGLRRERPGARLDPGAGGGPRRGDRHAEPGRLDPGDGALNLDGSGVDADTLAQLFAIDAEAGLAEADDAERPSPTAPK